MHDCCDRDWKEGAIKAIVLWALGQQNLWYQLIHTHLYSQAPVNTRKAGEGRRVGQESNDGEGRI